MDLTKKFSVFFRLELDVWYLAFSMSMLTFASGLISSFVSVVLRNLGASFLAVGMVASGYNLALAMTAFLGSSLCARFGGKKIFVLSLLFSLFAIFSYATAVWIVNWLLIALGLFFGRVAWGLRDTSSFSIVAKSADETKKATAFGLLSTLQYLGAATSPVLGGVLAYCFGMPFLFSLSIPIISAAIVIISVKIKKAEVTSRRVFPSRKEVKDAVTTEKSVMLLLLLAFCGQFFSEFGNPYRFIFMKEELRSPDYLLPLPQTAITIASLIAGIPSGHFSDITKRRKPFIVLGYLIATIGVAFNAFALSPYMLIITFFLFGLSNVISWISLQAYFSDVGGTESSLIVGTYLASLWIGGIFSPPISGYVAESFGLRLCFLIELFGGVIVTCLLAVLFKEALKQTSRKAKMQDYHQME